MFIILPLKDKSSLNLEFIEVNFGRVFKLRPNLLGDIFLEKQMRPNGEISPNPVTLFFKPNYKLNRISQSD
jgi:hypothetical protein